MTRMRLKYIQAWVDGEGRPHHYFRRRGFKRVPLPGLVGSAEFRIAYEAALAQQADPVGINRNKAGSVSSSIASYYESQEWAELSDGTRGMRRAILEKFRSRYGEFPLGRMHAD